MQPTIASSNYSLNLQDLGSIYKCSQRYVTLMNSNMYMSSKHSFKAFTASRSTLSQTRYTFCCYLCNNKTRSYYAFHHETCGCQLHSFQIISGLTCNMLFCFGLEGLPSFFPCLSGAFFFFF